MSINTHGLLALVSTFFLVVIAFELLKTYILKDDPKHKVVATIVCHYGVIPSFFKVLLTEEVFRIYILLLLGFSILALPIILAIVNTKVREVNNTLSD